MTAAIPSPPFDGVSLGPFDVRVYGVMYVVAVAAAILIAARRWEARGGSRELVYEVAAWGFPAGLVGGRIYHVLTSPGQVPDAWWGPLAIWEGGLGIWGGILAGALVGVWILRRRRADVAMFLDVAAPALLVAQAIGRLGNYFNQELFGPPTELPWGVEIGPDHRPAAYLDAATFHPTFFYEIGWNLVLAGVLVVAERRFAIRQPGVFALYVAGYALWRIVAELWFRVDPATEALGLRLNLFVAAATMLAGLAAFWAIQRGGDAALDSPTKRRRPRS